MSRSPSHIPRNVAQVCLTRSWGGMEMSALKFARLFRDRGWNSRVICLKTSPLEEKLQNEPDLIYLPLSKAKGLGSILKTHDFVKDNELNAVFLHNLRDLWTMTPALWRLQEVQMVGFARMFLSGISKKDLAHTLLYSRLNHLIALTSVQKRNLQLRLPAQESQYMIIPNGVDLNRFKGRQKSPELRRQMGVQNEGEVLVGVVGRLDPQKGQEEFVRAAAQLLKSHSHLRFVLIGSDNKEGPPFRPHIEKLIESLSISDRVHLTGHVDNTEDYLASLDIFVLPSYEEAFGNVTLEAMACELPIAATKAGGTLDILQHEENALLFEPRRPEALAQTVERYLNDTSLATRMAQAARKRVVETFDMEVIFEQVASLAFKEFDQR